MASLGYCCRALAFFFSLSSRSERVVQGRRKHSLFPPSRRSRSDVGQEILLDRSAEIDPRLGILISRAIIETSRIKSPAFVRVYQKERARCTLDCVTRSLIIRGFVRNECRSLFEQGARSFVRLIRGIHRISCSIVSTWIRKCRCVEARNCRRIPTHPNDHCRPISSSLVTNGRRSKSPIRIFRPRVNSDTRDRSATIVRVFLFNAAVMKMIGERWSNLDDDLRQRFVQLASEEKTRYDREMIDYRKATEITAEN